MITSQGLLLAIGWFLVRFGIPVLFTVIVCWIFKKFDDRWQAEARSYREKSGIENLAPIVRCWVLNECPEEQREECPAYKEQNIPCWQHFRAANGYLQEKCLSCRVFRGAPKPVIGD